MAYTKGMRTELVVSTYNTPHSLKLALASVHWQSVQPDCVAVADDGSGKETADVITAFAEAYGQDRVRHVWHEDKGFQKNVILNKAIASSTADFMIFMDGDCLLHPNFIKRHVETAHRGAFYSGSLIRLSRAITDAIYADAHVHAGMFDQSWLKENGVSKSWSRYLKSAPFPFFIMAILDRLSPVRRSWAGCNASTFRDNLLAVNGFDETMPYGAEDKELGERLRNFGIKARHLRYTAPILHLDHDRPYVD